MKTSYNHSVFLEKTKCKGCTNCLKHCPNEAIRIRDGHAVIDASRCIDCGECIRICPYHAKKAVCDKLSCMDNYKYKIALPAPALYGQFDNLDDIDYVLQGLYDYGFDDVYEVAKAAELVSCYTRRYLKKEGIKKPVISSACPAVARLISLRFPLLCDNLMPILPPIEIAAMEARRLALEAHPELTSSDIGICFISPCPAKASYVKNETGGSKSNVDHVVSISDMYFALLNFMKRDTELKVSTETGIIGLSWASSGGESSALFNDQYLAADGIENVIRVLIEIERESFPHLEFVELNACPGGCVGGVMTVANPFIAKARLQTLKRYMPVSQNRIFEDNTFIPEEFTDMSIQDVAPVVSLHEDKMTSMRMMMEIEEIAESLPALDCGSCGAPTCYAFAEDIVKGQATKDECIVHIRRKINALEHKNGE